MARGGQLETERRLCCDRGFVALRVVSGSHSPLFVALGVFLVTSLINGRSLCNAVVMAPPGDVGTVWEFENTLDGFATVGVSVDNKVKRRER